MLRVGHCCPSDPCNCFEIDLPKSAVALPLCASQSLPPYSRLSSLQCCSRQKQTEGLRHSSLCILLLSSTQTALSSYHGFYLRLGRSDLKQGCLLVVPYAARRLPKLAVALVSQVLGAVAVAIALCRYRVVAKPDIRLYLQRPLPVRRRQPIVATSDGVSGQWGAVASSSDHGVPSLA